MPDYESLNHTTWDCKYQNRLERRDKAACGVP